MKSQEQKLFDCLTEVKDGMHLMTAARTMSYEKAMVEIGLIIEIDGRYRLTTLGAIIYYRLEQEAWK